jgi:hypothetical protein
MKGCAAKKNEETCTAAKERIGKERKKTMIFHMKTCSR